MIAEALDHVAETGIVYYEPEFIGSKANFGCAAIGRTCTKPKPALIALSRVPGVSGRNRGNCERRRALHGCGASTTGGRKRAIS